MTSDEERVDTSPYRGNPHNYTQGDPDTVVQAGAIHGDVNVTASSAGDVTIPRQLPMAVSGFVNRTVELSQLDTLVPAKDDTTGRTSGAVVISAIGGSPGVGKTTLALHWAHRMRYRYVDGDLYVNMRGHGPGPRLDASTALDSLLRTLEVPSERIPDDLDGRSALYRSRLDGKHMLILIDDAVSPEQVRPLLPASPTCLVLVTSRSTLSGLVAREGAQRMSLDTLTTEESLSLLRTHLGQQRLNAEPDMARALVAHCAHLPLALRILTERLLDRPDAPLADIAAELDAENERLDTLGITDDELSDVRAVFDSSYTALPSDAARMFRVLGVHPGIELDAASCAAAAGMPVKRTRALLDQLAGTHLLQRLGRERYRLHDLLRMYAAERFHAEEPVESQTEVIDKLARWYLASARNAVLAVMPNFRPVPDPEGQPSGELLTFDTAHAALAWFEQERPTLISTLRAAVDHELYELAWKLPVTLGVFFELHQHRHEDLDIHAIGLGAARSLDDRKGQARTLIGLADAQWMLDEIEQALETYVSALEAAREVGDGWTEGFALYQLGNLRWQRNRDSEAPTLIRHAIDAFRRAEDKRGEGMALLSLAAYEQSLGHHDTALEHCGTALTIFTDIADTWSAAWARCYRADALTSANQHRAAIAEYQTALPVFIDLADIDTEAITRIGLGRTHRVLGETDQARNHLGTALDLLRSVDDSRAEEIEAELAQLA
ncbi:tetratricopeptide (TPR) repeat protein [Haloactinospora alba]|uniref:Tetratricopeptide (TPR) repeat protein n=1 Tax=Haloactinospora alba TaxID=405555 RepID=A0A543NK30_9ACTN|nr:tetratricopeptide repeat protein [Haloactinospora alba]TQN32225.1 tetratricopeptide (TPR) repeat protein [Haloactinospora alba]